MVRFFRRKQDEGNESADGQAATTAEGQAATTAEGESGATERSADETAATVAEATEKTRRGFFNRIGGLFRRGGLDETVWEELEETLVLADTGAQTTMKIIDDVRERVDQEKITDPDLALGVLKDELVDILSVEGVRGRLWGANGRSEAMPKPAVILVVGVNGTGKTTSIGKLAHSYKASGLKVLLAAGDTFRAAAIEQLKQWGEGAGVEVVAHQQGADPGAVIFDALIAAEKRGADVLIIDTAGRLHTKANLMEELRKVNRVIQRKFPDAPHEVLLVLDATTGQNAMQQATYFTEAVGVTGVLLSKLDGTAKGGVVFSVCDRLGVPVRFVGTGERPQDLARFEPREFVEALFA
jgi:fused signal recognition particle receptor